MIRQWIHIDFDSEEALYVQLRNQIILNVACARLHEGDVLPSVRGMADTIGINMHTVNKAYSVLRKEGIVSLDQRRGAVICIDTDHLFALRQMREELQMILAKAICKGITREEAHQLVDAIYTQYE